MITRRCFLGATVAAAWTRGAGFPLIDFHAHVEGDLTIERALKLAEDRGVKLGVVEHGGCGREIGSDEELRRYVKRLAAYPVYKGMQAEGHDWMRCFSKEAVAGLDYVLADALTFLEKDGRWVRLWTPEAKVHDKQDFMERYVDFNVRVMAREPIDIFANPTFLPSPIGGEYDALWTASRMKKVIDAAAKHGVAIEINSRYRIPSAAFIRRAREAGVKFSFGSNRHDEGIGKLEYCVEMVRECGLTPGDMFMPAEKDKKPVLRRG